jgi:HD superfamily phosphohydrolase
LGVKSPKKHIIFDPIYGFIRLTPLEWEIVHSPFYQRLRWLKQIGLSCYVFPGAEHSRFGHSIGSLFNAHNILISLGKAVSEKELMSSKYHSKEKKFHQSIRLGALMHDLGTFPFSHTTEGAYIKFKRKITGGLANNEYEDDHENLGSFVIKNTNFEGGITHILEKYEYSPKYISKLVKGNSESILANQILHSEVDCDRMDYLLRDAHFTGLEYGTYDRDYLLHHFSVSKVAGHEILSINHNALHCVEDFLMSRFSWYSQVVRSSRGAKYDAVAEHICSFMLNRGLIYTYNDLLELACESPLKFFGFNDNFFLTLIQNHLIKGAFDKDPKIYDMATGLLLAKGPKTIHHKSLSQKLINQDSEFEHRKIHQKAEEKVEEIKAYLAKHGGPKDWIISDLPSKDINFVNSLNSIVKNSKESNILLERDPVKISSDDGEVKLLAEIDNSTISILQNTKNYIPNVFCSQSAYDLLLKAKLILP